MLRVFVAGALASALMAGAASAQDIHAQPSYGSAKLAEGFGSQSVSLTAGGSIYANSEVSSQCRGYIASAPDYTVRYGGGASDLMIGAASLTDTTLVVLGADGTWYCDDDGAGYPNPQLLFRGALAGTYRIWVGTYGSGAGDATLTISERSSALAFGASPLYGSVSLGSGQIAAPHVVPLMAGGPVYASDETDWVCGGYVSAAPSYVLHYSAGERGLTIGADSTADTTLVVRGPDGQWYCDDDSGGSLNPLLRLANPPSGAYQIWVGTWGSVSAPAATLSIADIGGTPGQTGTVLDPDGQPIYGAVSLAGGFVPDPREVQLSAGGEIYAPDAVGSQCRGYISASPSYVVDYTASGGRGLIVSAGSSTDTTLVVRGPDGTWFCDDDGGVEGLNPALSFPVPQSGSYAIWVGTYSRDRSATTRLQISEMHSL